MLYSKISNWLKASVEEVLNKGTSKNVHIDKFVEIKNLSNIELLFVSIRLFNNFIKVVENQGLSGVNIYLSIELKEYGDHIKGPPENIEILANEIDEFSMPEVIVYKPLPLIYPPIVEIYRKPLIFSEFSNFENLYFFYKEDRTIEMMRLGYEFRRELVCLFIPPLVK